MSDVHLHCKVSLSILCTNSFVTHVKIDYHSIVRFTLNFRWKLNRIYRKLVDNLIVIVKPTFTEVIKLVINTTFVIFKLGNCTLYS